MVCFSVDNPISLENVESKWIDEILEYCPGVKLVLVGSSKFEIFPVIRPTKYLQPLNVISETTLLLLSDSLATTHDRCSTRTGSQ
jgi:hypothetical protein